MRSLPNLIEKYPDESLEGFLSRLALVNYREVNELGISNITSKATEEEIGNYLNKISLLSDQNITGDFLFPYKWFLEGLTLPGWKNGMFTRFCPECLEERKYHRASWSLSHHLYCYKHLAFMVENCSDCQKKMTVKDVVMGKCGLCNSILENYPISKVGGEPRYLNEDGDFKQIESPFLRHSLDIREQFILTKWLSYVLVVKTDLFNLQLNPAEKLRFASSGYYHDVVQQFKIMSLAYELLSAWPSKLVIFLNIHFKGSFDRTKAFMSRLVNSMPNKRIKNVLVKTRLQKDVLENIRFEEQHYDRSFMLIEDFMEIYGVTVELIHSYINKYQINLHYHPRLKLKMIHEDYIEKMQIELSNYSGKIKFMALSSIATRWNVSVTTAKLICEMNLVPMQYLLEEECYNLNIIEKLDTEASKYLTVHDLLDKSIWSSKTLKEHLKRMNVNIVFQSSTIYWDHLYLKEDMMEAFNFISNNKNDYMDRKNVIKELGFELFKAGQLDVYYPSGEKKDSPYFLKSDVEHVMSLFNTYKSNKEVSKYRHHEITKRALNKK